VPLTLHGEAATIPSCTGAAHPSLLGSITPGAGGALEASLDIALVDYTGGVAEGRLIRGDNPVLMTMELVLEALRDQGGFTQACR